MKAFVVVASLCALCVADVPDYDAMWQRFKKDYGKTYAANGKEEQERFQIFKSNVDFIEDTNAKKLSYTLGINEFADLTRDEFAQTHLGYQSSKLNNQSKTPFPTRADVPDFIDWKEKGAVTPVKNQAHCGSCWAFSSTGSIEGAYFVATGKLVSLSEQDLVSCDNAGTDRGCAGGLMDHAFDWVKDNGICAEADYPYSSGNGTTGICKLPRCKPAVTVTGYTDVPPHDEDALKIAVAQQPVSVAIEGDKGIFQHYKSGILDDPSCGTKLDHGVLAVGYGSSNGTDYWKVKNSWGTSWGMQGYVLMARGKNQCGIASEPSYPTGVKVAPPPSPPSPPAPPPPAHNQSFTKVGQGQCYTGNGKLLDKLLPYVLKTNFTDHQDGCEKLCANITGCVGYSFGPMWGAYRCNLMGRTPQQALTFGHLLNETAGGGWQLIFTKGFDAMCGGACQVYKAKIIAKGDEALTCVKKIEKTTDKWVMLQNHVSCEPFPKDKAQLVLLHFADHDSPGACGERARQKGPSICSDQFWYYNLTGACYCMPTNHTCNPRSDPLGSLFRLLSWSSPSLQQATWV